MTNDLITTIEGTRYLKVIRQLSRESSIDDFFERVKKYKCLIIRNRTISGELFKSDSMEITILVPEECVKKFYYE